MRIFTFFLFIMVSAPLLGQEFSTKLYFEGANGQTDTLTVGYDPSASLNIDEQYGELDISDQPITGFDIRLGQCNSSEFDFSDLPPTEGNYPNLIYQQTKIDIVPRDCESYNPDNTVYGEPPNTTILIPVNELPVTMTWDSLSFDNGCLGRPFLTSWPTNTWWDTQSFPTDNVLNSWLTLSENSSLTIEEPFGHQYITENGDTLMMLFLVLYDVELTVSTYETVPGDVDLFPNPVIGSTIFLNGLGGAITEYVIYDIDGKEINAGSTRNSISVDALSLGHYFLSLKCRNKSRDSKRFIKL